MVVAFNARDLEGWMAHATDDFTMESRFSSVAGTIFRHREGVIAWWSDLADAWEWMEIELEDSADVGTDRTVLLCMLRAIGHGSGMRLDEPIAQRWYWRGERLGRIEYLDRKEAELIVDAA
jgi:SnoaL-like domain